MCDVGVAGRWNRDAMVGEVNKVVAQTPFVESIGMLFSMIPVKVSVLFVPSHHVVTYYHLRFGLKVRAGGNYYGSDTFVLLTG